jgi:hypothetical protein
MQKTDWLFTSNWRAPEMDTPKKKTTSKLHTNCVFNIRSQLWGRWKSRTTRTSKISDESKKLHGEENAGRGRGLTPWNAAAFPALMHVALMMWRRAGVRGARAPDQNLPSDAIHRTPSNGGGSSRGTGTGTSRTTSTGTTGTVLVVLVLASSTVITDISTSTVPAVLVQY